MGCNIPYLNGGELNGGQSFPNISFPLINPQVPFYSNLWPSHQPYPGMPTNLQYSFSASGPDGNGRPEESARSPERPDPRVVRFVRPGNVPPEGPAQGARQQHETPPVRRAPAVQMPGYVSCAQCGYANPIPQSAAQAAPFAPYAPFFQPFMVPVYSVWPVFPVPYSVPMFNMGNWSYGPRFDWLIDGRIRFDSEFSGFHNSYQLKRIQHFLHDADGRDLAIEEKTTWLGRISDGILGYRLNAFLGGMLDSGDPILQRGIFCGRVRPRRFRRTNWENIDAENQLNPILSRVYTGNLQAPASAQVVAPAATAQGVITNIDYAGTLPRVRRVRFSPYVKGASKDGKAIIGYKIADGQDIEIEFKQEN